MYIAQQEYNNTFNLRVAVNKVKDMQCWVGMGHTRRSISRESESDKDGDDGTKTPQ